MDLVQFFNITGLAISFLGAFLVFVFTPKIDYNIWAPLEEEAPQLDKKAKHKNNWGKIGIFLIFIGFGFQLVANIL